MYQKYKTKKYKRSIKNKKSNKKKSNKKKSYKRKSNKRKSNKKKSRVRFGGVPLRSPFAIRFAEATLAKEIKKIDEATQKEKAKQTRIKKG